MPPVRRSTTQFLRVRSTTRAGWLSARVRNVLAQRMRLALLTLLGATVLFAALAMVPSGRTAVAVVERAAPQLATADTLPAVEHERAAQAARVAAVERLQTARARMHPDAATATPAPRVGQRTPAGDSLLALAANLDALIRRADAAPLLDSYRRLAESLPLRGDPRVRALLDSLLDVDRERDEFGAGAAVDPVFVSLTMRGNALGRSIVAIATTHSATLRREGLALRARLSARDTMTPSLGQDTIPARLALDSAESLLAAATAATIRARQGPEPAPPVRVARPPRSSVVPLPLLAGAALVLGAVVVFASLLVEEARRPRIADAMEAERLAGVRVVSAVRLREIPAAASRRATDRIRAPLLDPALDAYRLLAWRSLGPGKGHIVAVVGDSAFVRAIVASNVAAALANDTRNTLLVDIDFREGRVADVLGISPGPGVAAVLENRNRWPETIVPVVVGRERQMDVIPSGKRARALGPAEAAALTVELERAARRYDVTVVSAPADLAQQALPGRDVLLSVVALKTRQAAVARDAAIVRRSGGELLGVALWHGVTTFDTVVPSHRLA